MKSKEEIEYSSEQQEEGAIQMYDDKHYQLMERNKFIQKKKIINLLSILNLPTYELNNIYEHFLCAKKIINKKNSKTWKALLYACAYQCLKTKNPSLQIDYISKVTGYCKFKIYKSYKKIKQTQIQQGKDKTELIFKKFLLDLSIKENSQMNKNQIKQIQTKGVQILKQVQEKFCDRNQKFVACGVLWYLIQKFGINIDKKDFLAFSQISRVTLMGIANQIEEIDCFEMKHLMEGIKRRKLNQDNEDQNLQLPSPKQLETKQTDIVINPWS